MDLAVLEKLIVLCKKHGVTSCKADGFEFSLPAPVSAGPVREDMKALAQALGQGNSPEELLFASAPQYMSQDEVMKKLKEMRGE
jgi:hypothetical protein